MGLSLHWGLTQIFGLETDQCPKVIIPFVFSRMILQLSEYQQTESENYFKRSLHAILCEKSDFNREFNLVPFIQDENKKMKLETSFCF